MAILEFSHRAGIGRKRARRLSILVQFMCKCVSKIIICLVLCIDPFSVGLGYDGFDCNYWATFIKSS